MRSSSSSQRSPLVALRQLGVDLRGRALLDESAVDAGVDRQLGQLPELRARLEEEDVDPGDHLRDVLVGDVGELALAELRERHVRAVAEEQELEMVLPHEVAAAKRPVVGVEDLVERRVPVVLEGHLVALVLREIGDAEVRDLRDQRLHLLLELRVELVPVLVVVARTSLEELHPLGDLGRIGDRVAGDVDVAVHDAVVDAHRRRNREDPVLPDTEGLVRAVDTRDVEGRHGKREVHRVPEPEPALVGLAPRLVEQRVVGVHLLPPLAPGWSGDLVGARKRARRPRRGHVLSSVGAHVCIQPSSAPGAWPTGPRALATNADHQLTMRAISQATLGGPEVLELVEMPRPDPAPTEVLVRVTAAGVNPVDWKVRAGGGFLGEPPFTVGWDVAGVVEELGRGVTRFQAGDRVFGMPRFPKEAAAYAEYVTSPSRQLARTPESIGDVEAAALPLAGLTAWQALVETADVQPGQRVLILGAAGGVGHLGVQIAKARGAHVIGTARSGKHAFLHDARYRRGDRLHERVDRGPHPGRRRRARSRRGRGEPGGAFVAP